MKPTLYAVLIMLSIGFSLSTDAQTPITISSSTTSSLAFGSDICPGTNCIITIAPAAVFTIDNTTQCNICVFTGGTVIIAPGSNLTLKGVDSFNNMQVFVNQSFSQNNNVTFYGDTVALNASMSFINGRTDFDSSRVAVNAALSMNTGTFYKDSLHVNANISFSNATDSFAYSNVTVATGTTIAANTSAVVGTTFAFNGSGLMSSSNGMTSSSSNYYLSGTSKITANSTSLTGDKVVMSGTVNSWVTSNALTMSSSTVTMNATSSGNMQASTMTTASSTLSATALNAFNVTNAASITGTSLTMGGGSSGFTAGSLTASGGTITANTGSTVSITNALKTTNTIIKESSARIFGGSTTITGGSVTANSSQFKVASLTTNNTTFTAASSVVTSTNPATLNNTIATFVGATVTVNSLTTNGGSLTASTASTITSTNGVDLEYATTNLSSTTFTGNSLLVTGGSIGITDGSTTITNGIDFDGPIATLSGTATFSGSSMTVEDYSTFIMSGTAAITSTNAFTVDNSTLYLNGNNKITGGSMTESNGSWVRIGDGTVGSTANIQIANSFFVDNLSNMGIANNNNYLKTTDNGLKSNTISCGGGGTQNACATGFVYGCGTISNNFGVQCTILAAADMNLTAAFAGAGQVNGSFIDRESTTADHYLVQRNTGDNQWNTISTVAAGGYTTGEYRFTDAGAPAGATEYRIQRIDKNGKISYSIIVTVNIGQTGNTISFHPNPVVGGLFYVSTPGTAETVVNIFTMTGQLLMHANLKGQTQYAIHLPVQAQSLGAVMVQTIGQTGTHSFTVLVK
jgi:hypothetical protein